MWSQFTVAKGGNNLLSTRGHGRKENYRGAKVSTAKTTHTLAKMLFKMYVYVLCLYMCVVAGARGGQRRVLGPQKLESNGLVSQQSSVLGTKLGLSG